MGEVFRLKYFGERSLKEIGQLMGKSESWARGTYFRAREQLRRKLHENGM